MTDSAGRGTMDSQANSKCKRNDCTWTSDLPFSTYADSSIVSPRSSSVSLMMVLQLLHSKTAGEPPGAFIQRTNASAALSWQRQAFICCKYMHRIQTIGQQDPSMLAQYPRRAQLHRRCSDRWKTGAVRADVGSEGLSRSGTADVGRSKMLRCTAMVEERDGFSASSDKMPLHVCSLAPLGAWHRTRALLAHSPGQRRQMISDVSRPLYGTLRTAGTNAAPSTSPRMHRQVRAQRTMLPNTTATACTVISAATCQHTISPPAQLLCSQLCSGQHVWHTSGTAAAGSPFELCR